MVGLSGPCFSGGKMKQIHKIYKSEARYKRSMRIMNAGGWRAISTERVRQHWGVTMWVFAIIVGCATFGIAVPFLLFMGRGERIYVVWER